MEVIIENVDFRYGWTLSAGTASAASFAARRPGSSARAVPAGVASLRSNQLCLHKNDEVMDMMTKNQMNQREQLEILTIEQLVPHDHLARKLDAAIDFSFIYPLVEDLYSTVGRPSIDPVVLIKMTFIQYTFGIRSMRQTIKEIETNMSYRWFLGFGFQRCPISPHSERTISVVLQIRTYLNRFFIGC